MTSISLFRAIEVPGASAYSEYAWHLIDPNSTTEGLALDSESLSTFTVDAKFVGRRIAYIDRFIEGADDVLAGGPLRRKLICTRYTSGLPTLKPEAIADFRTAMYQYREALTSNGLDLVG